MPIQSAILSQAGTQSAEAKREHEEEKSNANAINATVALSNKSNIDPKPEVNGRQIRGLHWLVIRVALYNTFNIKWIFFTTVVLFEVVSALCGAAPTISALIVGRVIAESPSSS